MRSLLKIHGGRRAAAPIVGRRGRSTLELAVFDPPKSSHIAEDMATPSIGRSAFFFRNYSRV